MELTPVSFAKPRDPAKPRVAASAATHPRFWTEAERQILRDHYEAKGAQFCKAMLPGRALGSVYREANKMGFKGKHATARVTVKVTAELDAKIRTAWEALDGRKKGEVAALADSLGVPRHWLSKRALTLGLALPTYRKEPPWTPAELDLLRRVPLHDPHRASATFRDHGFARTPAAITVMAKRQEISRRFDATLSASRAAKILGVDVKAVTRFAIDGTLKAERRQTQRTAQQGGDPWSIDRADFRQFVIDHVGIIDFRKVDKFALVDLLTRVRPE